MNRFACTVSETFLNVQNIDFFLKKRIVLLFCDNGASAQKNWRCTVKLLKSSAWILIYMSCVTNVYECVL